MSDGFVFINLTAGIAVYIEFILQVSLLKYNYH